jgi:hypothetical protein
MAEEPKKYNTVEGNKKCSQAMVGGSVHRQKPTKKSEWS